MNKFRLSLALSALCLSFVLSPASAFPREDSRDSRYRDDYYDSRDNREMERERNRIEFERERLDAERAQFNSERYNEELQKAQPAPAARVQPERCPSGFSPSERKCTNEERRKGCKDMRLPGGLGCVHRGG